MLLRMGLTRAKVIPRPKLTQCSRLTLASLVVQLLDVGKSVLGGRDQSGAPLPQPPLVLGLLVEAVVVAGRTRLGLRVPQHGGGQGKILR